MPVEIKELVVRAVVGSGRGETSAAPAGTDRPEHEDLVEACVRETLRILRKSKER